MVKQIYDLTETLKGSGVNILGLSTLEAGAYVCTLKGPGNEQSRQKLMVVK
jgi:hypothetical protein